MSETAPGAGAALADATGGGPVQSMIAPGPAGDSRGQTPDFRDHKAPGAFRTIGEVAQALGIRQHVLRYWEDHFPMLKPVKRSGNRRYYRPEDVALIENIDRLVHREGYTLRGACQAIEAARQRVGRAAPPSPPPGASGPSLLRELIAIRARIAAALEA